MTVDLIGAVGGLVAVGVIVLAVAGWLSWTAGRLDRMHLRCEGAAASLAAALAQRRALSLEIAGQAQTDPATAVLLVDAAVSPTGESSDGPEPPAESRWQRESDLSAVIRVVWPPSAPSEEWLDLRAACRRARMARRIHNDLVATALALRRRRRVRWFHLAGRAPAPTTISFDDEPPP